MIEAEAHQALSTLYTLERQYSQAMHHQLYSLLKQSGKPIPTELIPFIKDSEVKVLPEETNSQEIQCLLKDKESTENRLV